MYMYMHVYVYVCVCVYESNESNYFVQEVSDLSCTDNRVASEKFPIA